MKLGIGFNSLTDSSTSLLKMNLVNQVFEINTLINLKNATT